VLVKNCYSLISPGTELALFQHTHIGFGDPESSIARYPNRPGYAAVGRVRAVGEGVSSLAEGDWVFHPGGHRAYALLDAVKNIVLPLPAGADPKLAPFARMAQIASTALQVSAAAPGASVAVLGLGLIGNLAAQLFQQRGCDVLGITSSAARCTIAERCGLRCSTAAAGTEIAAVRSAFKGNGAATVIEATGAPQKVATALEMTARGGEVILLGSTRGKVELDVYKLIHRPGITVRGAHESVLAIAGGDERKRVLLKQSLEEIAAGRLVVAPLLSGIMDYRELRAAYLRLGNHPSDILTIALQWPE